MIDLSLLLVLSFFALIYALPAVDRREVDGASALNAYLAGYNRANEPSNPVQPIHTPSKVVYAALQTNIYTPQNDPGISFDFRDPNVTPESVRGNKGAVASR